jgi:hypothetical protein
MAAFQVMWAQARWSRARWFWGLFDQRIRSVWGAQMRLSCREAVLLEESAEVISTLDVA